MQSSPFPSSMPEPDTHFIIDPDENPVKEDVPNITIFLVQEEQLEEAKEEFEEINTIFVYSLESGPIKDTQLFTTCNRDIVAQFSSEDPLESYKKYGIPHNPNVKRRTNKRPMPSAAPLVAKAAPKTVPPAKEVAPTAPKLARSTSDQNKLQKAGTEAKASTPSLQRGNSDLFKSFAKTKPPKTKPNAHGTATPMSEDEAEDEDVVMMEETEEQKEKAEATRKARLEKEEQLKKMMEDDDEDEPMADAPTVDEAVEEGSPIDDKPKEEEEKEIVTVQGGRRRGRRRVMKKRTMKDDEGYLGMFVMELMNFKLLIMFTVTKEEAVWESFSEEEPEPKKKKANFTAPTTAKGKKAGGKPGQGNIMSFFGKK